MKIYSIKRVKLGSTSLTSFSSEFDSFKGEKDAYIELQLWISSNYEHRQMGPCYNFPNILEL